MAPQPKQLKDKQLVQKKLNSINTQSSTRNIARAIRSSAIGSTSALPNVSESAVDKVIEIHDLNKKNNKDFSFTISPSEKEKEAKRIATEQVLGEFNIRTKTLSDASSDFLVINDVPLSNVAVSSINIKTDADVFVAETLRASKPIIEPKGSGLDMVDISVSFPNGSSQTKYLRRIVSQIIKHPFVFIENTKIREAIGYDYRTMMFALHNASLRSGGEAVGVIFLDLQLSIFNYKPFSNHFWYNSYLPGYKTEKIKSKVAGALLPGSFASRESFSYSVNKFTDEAFEDITPSDFNNNTPTVYPANSDAWMYYAKYLEEQSNELSEYNSDYIGLSVMQYKVFSPPEGSRAGSGNASKIFSIHGEYKNVDDFFNASKTKSYNNDTVSPNSTETYGGGTPIAIEDLELQSTGVDWREIHKNLVIKHHDRWKNSGSLLGDRNTKTLISPIIKQRPFRNASKCNVVFGEVVYRSGYRTNAWSEDGNNSYKTCRRMLREIKDGSADWAVSLTGYEKRDIDSVITSGVPVAVVWTGKNPDGERTDHVSFVHRLVSIKYIKNNISFLRYHAKDQHQTFEKPYGVYPANPNIQTNQNIEDIEIFAVLPREWSASDNTIEHYKQIEAQRKQLALNSPDSSVVKAEIQRNIDAHIAGEEDLLTPQSLNDRLEWIRDIEAYDYDGLGKWNYVNDQGSRNVFSRPLRFDVGGGIVQQSDIILSAITVNFGHRLAQVKPLGQHSPAWQFMGSGNKSGIFVFTAANIGGRASLMKLRDFYQTAQQNTRLFPFIEGAGVTYVDFVDITAKNKINNIMALSDIDKIIITNVENSTDSSQGVDLHSLVVSWIAYDVPNETLTARDQISVNVKFHIMKSLMNNMKFWTSGSLEDADKISQNDYITSGMGMKKITADTKGINYFKTEEYKKDLTVVRYRNRAKHHHTGPSSDVLKWDSASGSYKPPDNSKYTNVFWYTDLVRKLDSIIQRYKTRFPDLNIQHPGSPDGFTWADKMTKELGVKAVGIFNGKRDNNGLAGFVPYTDDKQRSLLISSLYDSMINAISNTVVNNAMLRISDEVNFINLFGRKTFTTIIDSYSEQVGECYVDLDMPPEVSSIISASDTNKNTVPYPPDFYIYDDSAENAVLDESNNPKNAENMVRSHLFNESRSIHEYVRKIMFGGNSVSMNSTKIRENKENLNEVFNAEYDYFGLGAVTLGGASAWGAFKGFGNKILADGIKIFSAVLDDAGIDTQDQAQANAEIFRAAASDYYNNLSNTEKTLDGFLDMTLDWTPTSDYFTLSSDAYTSENSRVGIRQAAKAHIYGSYTHPSDFSPLKEIKLGPNEAQMGVDSIVSGKASPRIEQTTYIDPENYNPQLLTGTSGSDLTSVGLQDKPIPAKTNNDYTPPAASEDFTDIFSKHASSVSTNSRRKDLSMRRAYPTFKIYFIDEDSSQGTSKLKAFDDFYSYSCVQEIRVIRSRKIAADLAIIRLTNVGNTLITKRFQRGDDDLMREAGVGNGTIVNPDGTVKGGTKQKPIRENATGLYAETDKENPYGAMMLQPGVKTQIRLGYAADPDNLETVFLGQIVEVQPHSDNNLVEVVCQGYGAELEAGECGDLEKAAPAYSTQSALSAAIIQPYVTHFGRRTKNALYNPSEVRTYLDGGEATDFFHNLNPLNLFGSVMSSVYHEKLRKYNFLNDPQDDNIYAPPISLYTTGWSRFWNNAAVYRPLMSTPWDIFKEHELRHPGFVSSPVPYGHSGRMTMFFGSKGQNYWKTPPSKREIASSLLFTDVARSLQWDVNKIYGSGVGAFTPEVRQKLEKLHKKNPMLYKAFMQSQMGMGGEKAMGFALGRIFGRYVPFRNYHTFTSEHHILSNEIRANVEGTYNTVEVRYSEEEDVAVPKTFAWSETLGKFFANEGKETNALINEVKSGTDGVFTLKLNDKMPEHLVRKHVEAYPSCITDYMANRYAQGLLIRGLKDVYRGELSIIGDETIKPYDICMLQDNKNEMYGPIEVEQVVHIFNSEVGFRSVITPDLCIDFNDFTGKGIMDAIIQISALAWAISTDSTMAAMSKDRSTTETVSSAVVDGFFALGDYAFGTNMGHILGSAMLMHYDQTGSPFIITPLSYGGKPMLGLSLAPEYGNWASNLWGDFKEWVDDFKEGAAQMDFGESLQEWYWDAEEWIAGAAGYGNAYAQRPEE